MFFYRFMCPFDCRYRSKMRYEDHMIVGSLVVWTTEGRNETMRTSFKSQAPSFDTSIGVDTTRQGIIQFLLHV